MKILIIILCGLFLSSCGQYGSLYLPGGRTAPKNLQPQKNASSTIQEENM